MISMKTKWKMRQYFYLKIKLLIIYLVKEKKQYINR